VKPLSHATLKTSTDRFVTSELHFIGLRVPPTSSRLELAVYLHRDRSEVDSEEQ